MSGIDEAKTQAVQLRKDAELRKETATVKEQTQIVKLDEKYFADHAMLGTEDVTNDDLPTPTIALIQPNSKMVDKENRPYQRGMFYYKATDSLYKDVEVAFLVFTKREMPTYETRLTDKKVMTKNHVYLGCIMPEMKPFQMFFKSTGIGVSKKFLGDVRGAKRPMYALKVKLTSEYIKGDKGEYYKPIMEIVGSWTDDQIVQLEELTRTYDETFRGEVETKEPLPFE